jgi:hypothetical protein
MKKVLFVVLLAPVLWACEKNPDAPAKVSTADKARIEQCIEIICDKVFISEKGLVVSGNESFEALAVDYYFDIPQESALRISKNWNYDAPRYYQNNADGILYNYETDACDVVKKLDEYVMVRMVKSALDNNNNCERVAVGEMGDYVMKCHNSLLFAYVLKEPVSAKFQSASKDDISEYLADKESVYVNVSDQDRCFRVMNSDQDVHGMYAVIVCE